MSMKFAPLALAAVAAAPASAAVQTLNIPFPDAGDAVSITVGGNATPQFEVVSFSGNIGSVKTEFRPLNGSKVSQGYVTALSDLDGTTYVADPVRIGDSVPNIKDNEQAFTMYVGLKFDINGQAQKGVLSAQSVYADGNGVLTSISYDAVPTSAVPEPMVWAQLIAGFALVGGAMRARRRRAALAA